MTHRINTRGLLGALACGTLAIAAAGCRDDATHPITGSGAASGASRPSGDDLIVGLGNNPVTVTANGPALGPKLNDDFSLSNGFVSIGVDAVGMDTSSPVLDSAQSKGVPLQNTVAPTGGNLVDISIVGASNDQWVTNGIGVIGASLVGGQGSFLPPDNLVVWFEIIPDTSPAITALGFPQFVESQGTLRRLAVRGVILNNTTRTAANAAVDGAITNGADLIKTNGPVAAIGTSFRENIPDRFQILCHTAGAGAVNTFVPIFVTQVYALSEGNAVLTETTVIQHAVPNGDAVRISQAAEFIGVGAAGNSSLDTLAGGPMWVDPVAVLVGGGLSVPVAQGTIQTLVTNGLLPAGSGSGGSRPSVTSAELNRAIRLAGNPQPFPSDNYGQGVVPYISFVGRGEPEVSYTYFDAIAGNVVLNRDPRQAGIALAVQLRSDPTVPADNTATATVNEASVGRLAWARKIAVGRSNDVDSSASQAIRVTRDAPRAATFTPNYIFDVVSLQGTLTNAPEGTIVTITETTPTFFNSFNPNGFTPASLPASLTGSTNTSSILGVGQPSLTLIPGSLRLEPISLFAETLRTTVRVGAGGSWVATLPAGSKFQFQNPFNVFQAPTVTANDTTSLYNFRALLPGGGAPVTIATNVTVTVGVGVVNVGTTDVGAGVGTFSYSIDQTGGGSIPGVITILTSTGVTPTADFSIQTGIEEGFERSGSSGNSAVTANGTGRMTLAVGTYQVVASAGFDYETQSKTVAITSGSTTTESFVLSKVQNVASRSFVSADFHVHSGESPDSGVPGPDRVRSLLAHGVEIYAQTEHDKIGDATGAIAQVGSSERSDISSRLKHMHGMEFTTDLPWLPGANPAAKSQCIGHYNAFPLVYRSDRSRGGAPQDEIRPNAIAYLGMRMQDGAFVVTTGALAGDTSGNEIVQLNHPRSATSTSALDGGDGLFSNLSFAFPTFDPTFTNPALVFPFGSNDAPGSAPVAIKSAGIQLLVDAPTVIAGNPTLAPVATILKGAMSFDTMEVLNGSQTINRYLQHRADWFSMLNRGVIKTAVGTSDNHRIDDRRTSADARFDTMFMGIARTMLVTSEGPADLTNDEVVALVKPSYNTPTATLSAPSALNPFGTLNAAVYRSDRMKAVVSTGPMIALSVTGNATLTGNTASPIGARIGVTAGNVDISVTVTGPTWVLSNCTEARIIVNGTQTATVALSGGTTSKTASFLSVDLSVDPTGVSGANGSEDTWVVVEVGQPLADVTAGVAPTGAYAQVYPNVPVVAFTNPIFFDRDGNDATFDACRNDE